MNNIVSHVFILLYAFTVFILSVEDSTDLWHHSASAISSHISETIEDLMFTFV